MEQIDFDMSTFHENGSAFFQYPGPRIRFFVETPEWDAPHDARVWVDQYRSTRDGRQYAVSALPSVTAR